MSLLADLAEWNELAFAALLLLGLGLAHELGLRLGHRAADRGRPVPDGVGVITGGLLGLLAFVLALTLTFANGRFAERRVGTLGEANAIGTAWTRAQAVGHPRGVEIARLLEEYARVRLAFTEAGRDDRKLAEITATTNRLQSQMAGHAAVIVREQPNPVSASLLSALNETFDAATAERFAFALHLPTQIFWLLISISGLSACVLGYQFGLKRSPLRVLAGLLLLTWTIVIVAILDLASPRIGAFRTGADVYRWTLQGFEGGFQIPPLPPAR